MPSEVLVKIFQFLQLEDLLRTVNRVCVLFYNLIENSAVLWKEIDLSHPLELTANNLYQVLRHSRKTETLLLPCATYHCANAN